MGSNERPRRRRHRTAGLTLVEVAVIICLAGVVVAVFVPAFFDRLRTSKIAEASEQLERLHQASAAYWSATHRNELGRPLRRCLPDAAGPAPAEPTVDPVEVDFAAAETPGSATWAALGFDPDHPTRYRYTFRPTEEGCNIAPPDGRPLVVLRAEGDLDGDGDRSLFERAAVVNDRGELVPSGVLWIRDRVE